MHNPIHAVYLLLCLVLVFGTNTADAWTAKFFSKDLGCADETNANQSTWLSYAGPDMNDTQIPLLMPCLDLGAEIQDPAVTCFAGAPDNSVNASKTQCEDFGGFVAQSVSVDNEEFCVAWEQPGCIGEGYSIWTPDDDPALRGCHLGVRVRSFQCLQ
ncbi:hypothetical protein F4777DRAFT_593555 [Nemania sp. FL0916]|nr:hypothetical protein F4777DRAFT_593555 [Nemania sp. FL0916]